MTVRLIPLTLDQLELLAVGDLAAASQSLGAPVPPDFADGQWVWQNFAGRIKREPTLRWWLTQYAVVDDDRIVGHVRLFPPLDRESQIGWHIDAIHRRRGLAQTAARELIALAEARHEIDRLVALIAHDNAASIGVAEKCGFSPDGEQRHRFGWLMRRFVLTLRD